MGGVQPRLWTECPPSPLPRFWDELVSQELLCSRQTDLRSLDFSLLADVLLPFLSQELESGESGFHS